MKSDIPISACIVTHNSGKKAVTAVNSLTLNTKNCDLRVTCIDNLSTDGTVALLKQNTGADVICLPQNIGFGGAHNLALSLNMGKYHTVVNPDITVNEDVLGCIVQVMEDNPDIVMAMPKICFPNGTEQKLPKKNPTFRYLFGGRISKKIRDEYTNADFDYKDITDIDFCSGCFTVIRSDVFAQLGGFDERFFMYMEDADLSRRAKKLGRVVICPQVSVVHDWERGSAKNIKLLMRHINSSFKYFYKWRNSK